MKKIFILFSGGASLAQYLINSDPAYKKEYCIVGSFTDNERAPGIDFFKRKHIPVLIKQFNKKGVIDRGDYFENCAEQIKSKYQPDLILCCGFMKIIHTSFLKKFPDIVLNVHPADLRIKDPQTGQRLYVGDKAVKHAYEAKLPYMCSTIHVVVPQIDAGPIVCVSPPYEVDYKTQTWEQVQLAMKDACDGPAGVEALRLFCESHSDEEDIPLGI